MKKNLYAVILAGGKGERLWPLSRSIYPKQLLDFSNETSLLDQTIDRAASFIEKENIKIITTSEQLDIIYQKVGSKVGSIIAEPVSRNTAPAIALACLEIAQHDPNAIVIFLSADHCIPQPGTFVDGLQKIADFAQTSNGIVLMGLRPTSPATGYGYIEYKNDTQTIHQVTRFHEKPSLERAQEYIKQPNMLWNIGVFCAHVKTFLVAFKESAPTVLQSVTAFLHGTKDAYAQSPHISIDYAILEKNKNVYVLPASFEWSDVGNLETFLSLRSVAQPVDIISIESKNNLVSSTSKIVALVGVEDLCVVQTTDALLIVKRSEVERVKEIVQALQKKGGGAYL